MPLTPNERPSYGSSKKGEYRVLPTDDESSLWTSCNQQADVAPVMTHRGLPYIDSGWEFSVFKDGNEMVKIPSGRFEEVRDPRYIANAELNYQKILKYVDAQFVATTRFCGVCIRQEFIESQRRDSINVRDLPEPTRSSVRCVLSGLLSLLCHEEWLPDLDIEPSEDGVIWLKNWMIDRSGIPKLFDFTTYYDVFRLDERRLIQELPIRAKRLTKAIEMTL
jgi:hypothetical protein